MTKRRRDYIYEAEDADFRAGSIGAVVKRLRLDLSMTQKELAERGKFDKGQIAQIEQGWHRPSLVILIRLAGALECTPNDLLQWGEEVNLEDYRHTRAQKKRLDSAAKLMT